MPNQTIHITTRDQLTHGLDIDLTKNDKCDIIVDRKLIRELKQQYAQSKLNNTLTAEQVANNFCAGLTFKTAHANQEVHFSGTGYADEATFRKDMRSGDDCTLHTSLNIAIMKLIEDYDDDSLYDDYGSIDMRSGPDLTSDEKRDRDAASKLPAEVKLAAKSGDSSNKYAANLYENPLLEVRQIDDDGEKRPAAAILKAELDRENQTP